MKKYNAPLSQSALIILFVSYSLLVFVGAMFKLQHWQFAQTILVSGVVLYIGVYIIILREVLINNVKDKTTWILCLLLFPGITLLFYLVQRNKLLSQTDEVR